MTLNLGTLNHSNGGVFSRAQALSFGETDRTLANAVRDGLLVRLRQGMYVAADVFASADDAGRHLLAARAAVTAQQGRVALTGISAAALHGLAIYDNNLDQPHLVRLDRGSSRHRAGTSHHIVRQDIEPDLTIVDGILTVNPARAVWEVACRTSLESGVVTADSALRQDPDLAQRLDEIARKFARFPGSARGRLAMNLASPLSDSPGESVTRVQFFRFRIPQPDQQFHVFDRNGELIGIADFYWEECRHLGEFDGKAKYEKYRRPGETAADCVFREKRREDRMRAGRRGMTRFVWSEVMPSRARRTMDELRSALIDSKRLYVTVPDRAAS
jgi:hypothetical protein